jgi:hypothetical protein
MEKGQEETLEFWDSLTIQWILKISLLIMMKTTLQPKLTFVNSKGHLDWSNKVAVGHHGISIQSDNVPNVINTPAGSASAH